MCTLGDGVDDCNKTDIQIKIDRIEDDDDDEERRGINSIYVQLLTIYSMRIKSICVYHIVIVSTSHKAL